MITVIGLAVPYEVSALVGQHRHRFRRGAFADFIRHQRCELWINHDHEQVVAPRTNVVFHEVNNGVGFQARICDPTAADFVRRALATGKLRGCSPGFKKQVVETNAFGLITVLRAELNEVSLMIEPRRPAFSETWVRAA